MLTDATRGYFHYLQAEKRYSDHTLRAYQHDLDTFLSFVAQHTGGEVTEGTLNDLSLDDLQSFQARQIMRDNLAKSTLNRQLSCVRGFFKWCLNNHPAITNTAIATCKNVKAPLTPPKSIPQKDLWKLIEEQAQTQDNPRQLQYLAIFTLLYGTGLRISEALNLNRGDFSDGHVSVMGKGNKQRHVPLLPIVKDVITKWLALTDGSAHTPAFTNPQGKRLSARAVQMKLKKMREEFDLPQHLTPHALRHSYATHLLQSGADVRTVQELLGHESVSTTQRYLEVDIDRLLTVHSQSHPLEGDE